MEKQRNKLKMNGNKMVLILQQLNKMHLMIEHFYNDMEVDVDEDNVNFHI